MVKKPAFARRLLLEKVRHEHLLARWPEFGRKQACCVFVGREESSGGPLAKAGRPQAPIVEVGIVRPGVD